MIDLSDLISDSTGLVALLALPLIAFGVIFLLAYDRELGGQYFGFGKRTFLLLTLAALVGWVANIPFFTWTGSVMAINIGGALVPIAISLAALGTAILPGGHRELGALLIAVAAAIGALMAVIILAPSRVGSLAFFVIFVGAGLLLLVLRRSLLAGPRTAGAEALSAFGLIALASWGTFLATQVVLGLGIESAFPAYLAVPAIVGAVSVPLRWPRRDGPALAYATTTLGVLLGADVLHQPALFAGAAAINSPFLGAIGGAGPFDLVFLSGPFALATAFTIDLILRRSRYTSPTPAPAGPALELPRSPDPKFTDALKDYSAQTYPPIPSKVVQVVDASIAETRQALGLAPATPDRPLEGLSTHPLFRSDLENLRALAAGGTSNRDDARRALVTGFLLQRGLLEILATRFATSQERIKAFTVDLTLSFLPAVPLLLLTLALANITNDNQAGGSVAFNSVVAALGAWPFVLFVGCEALWGATPGKKLMGLEVVGPSGSRPSLISLLARNLPKVLPLASLSITIGLAVVYAVVAPPSPALSVLLVIAGVAGVLLTGLVSVWVMRASPRRQRLGDLVAGTMVWKEGIPLTPWAPSPALPATAMSTPPPPPPTPPA